MELMLSILQNERESLQEEAAERQPLLVYEPSTFPVFLKGN